MKHTTKSILNAILTFGLVVGFFLCSGESEDTKVQVIWTLGWLTEMTLCAWGLSRLNPNLKK